MNELDYRKIKGIRSSQLKNMLTSPAYAKYKMDNPTDSTDALILGEAVHCLMLEPHNFEDKLAVRPVTDKGRAVASNTKQFKKWAELNEGKTFITEAQLAQAKAMVNGAFQNRKIREHIDSLVEVEGLWTWEEDGITFKCRFDGIGKDSGETFLSDVKTTSKLKEYLFMKSAISFGYDLQCYMYKQGALHNNYDIKKVFIPAVSSTKGQFEGVLYELTPEFLAVGERRFKEAVALYRHCMDTGEWPGYKDNMVVPLYPPSYLEEIDDDEDEDEDDFDIPDLR